MTSGQNRQKKQSEGVHFLLIQHPKYSTILSKKYSTILSKIHSYRLLFFSDFAHWLNRIISYSMRVWM